MKKQTILFFLLLTYLHSYCQKPFTIKVPCTDSFLLSIKGHYHFDGNTINTSVLDSKTHSAEMIKRMNAMHRLVEEAIPEPMGLEANWKNMTGQYRFAHDVDYAKGFHTYHLFYTCGFFDYYCGKKSETGTEIRVDGETGNWVTINVNGANSALGGGETIDSMLLNGLPVYRMRPVERKWKGYDLLHDFRGGARYVLIHRNGVLPYLPVSRKQYLDYRIPWLNRFYDRLIAAILSEMTLRSPAEQDATKKKWLDRIDQDYKNNPTKREAARKNYLASYQSDEDIRNEKKDILLKHKREVIARYEKELEKTTKEGLLDTPAIISDLTPVNDDEVIFTTEAEHGGMLVIENPAYFRKDLPKYMPQIFWLNWTTHDTPAGHLLKRMIEANFPIEKLQAMIDK